MPRRYKPQKRVPLADPVYNDVEVSKFINRLMKRGKKSLASRIFYSSIDLIAERTKEDAMEVFNKAIKNVTPLVEVKARRIGGSTYQVPIDVKPERGSALAMAWLIAYSKKRNGRSMVEKLANEVIDASNGNGASVKKRDETHKMAEANKAFAHYRY
ncbi:MAG: 30S ribosomal protein S7 [bacterium]